MGQTARSENVTFAADHEGQSDDPGRFIVEETITAGRKKSSKARDLGSENVTLRANASGRNRIKAATVGRNMSLLKTTSGSEFVTISFDLRSDRVTFSNNVPGRETSLLRFGLRRSENVTVRGKSAGRNSSPLGTVAVGRNMSPLDRPRVGKRHHCIAKTNFDLAVCRKDQVGKCHRSCGNYLEVGICHPIGKYRQRLRGRTDGRRAFSRSCSRGRWGTTRSI